MARGLARSYGDAAQNAGGRVVLACGRRNGFIELEVRDEGPGIPEAVQERMFERFHGGSRTGFGLGLAIAAQAADAIGASLEVDSSPASGTTARLTLPAVQMLAG